MLRGLEERCAEALAEGGCASASVAVARQDSVVFAEAFGLADIAAGRPATRDTAYLIASVTKPITATAVCVAAEQGLLDLDEPVERHLDGLLLSRHRDHGAPTVRQVLRHRAGLGAHYDFSYADSPASALSLRQSIERYGRLYREPGSRFEYSNLGYGLLDLVLESVTGQAAGAFVKDRVFGPLGLTSCHIGPSYEGPAAPARHHSADGRPYPAYDTSHRGASLGWATASDLALFGLSQAGGPGVLSPRTAASMRAGLPIGARHGYGLGWFTSRGGPCPIVAHSGSMGGVAAMLAVVPDLRLSVSVLTNQSGSAARGAIVEHVMNELVPGFTPGHLPPGDGSPARAVAVPPGTWRGEIDTYAGAVPLTLRVRADTRVEVGLDGAAPVEAETVAASEDWDLTALLPLQLPTPDARVNSPLLVLELNARRDGLTGAARAAKNGEDGGRLGNLLSHRCELVPV